MTQCIVPAARVRQNSGPRRHELSVTRCKHGVRLREAEEARAETGRELDDMLRKRGLAGLRCA